MASKRGGTGHRQDTRHGKDRAILGIEYRGLVALMDKCCETAQITGSGWRQPWAVALVRVVQCV